MHIMYLELKRVIKSPMTWISAGIAIALSVIISLSVISYAEYNYVDNSGKEARITGMGAIRANKKLMQPYEGQITVDKLQKALITFQDVYKQYGENIPNNVYHEKIAPINCFLDMIYQVYPISGDSWEALSKINPEELWDFYAQRTKTLHNQLSAKYSNSTVVQQKVQALNKKVGTPFIFREGYTNDAADNLAILISLLVLICAVVVSPIFSAEYQNDSDDILRCTKHGRVKLAAVKLCSSLLITFAMYAICVSIFIILVNNAYGWDSLQTSAQVLTSALSFVPLTVGQEQGFTILAGLITLLAVACFTLFLSTKCQNSTTALIIAITFCLLPSILYAIEKGNLINLLMCLLPADGAGLMNSFYYQLNSTMFIHIGSFSTWAPYIMVGAEIIEIPLFLALSIHSYCKHELA